jgi:hypothetical protein
LSTDENSAYKKQDCIGMPGGWAMRAGTAASGNGNTGAQQEVLAAMKGNFGTTLAAPSITSARFVTTAHVTGTPTVTVEVTWDERVTVAGSPTLTLANGNEGSGSGRTCVLTYTATGSTANRKRFTATPTSVTNDVITLGGGSQANIALASGTISDTTVGGTTTAALLVLTALTAQTITVTAS